MLRPLALTSATLVAGFAVAAGLFWALLNVPESNVAALGLSATLAVLTLLAVGFTIAFACGVARRIAPRTGLIHAARSLPAFIIGLAIFAMLWWSAGRINDWWQLHMGEVDAAAIRYFNLTRTSLLHNLVFASTWFVRWALGVSVVVAATAAGTAYGVRGIGAGLRDALRPLRLLATGVAMLLITRGVWRAVYWRPEILPPTQAEPIFAALKLGALAVVAAFIAASVVSTHSRTSGTAV